MDYQTAVNRLRAFNFAWGIMEATYRDPYCKECSDFTKACNELAVNFKEFEAEISSSLEEKLPSGFGNFQKDIFKRYWGLKTTENLCHLGPAFFGESQSSGAGKESGRCGLVDSCLPNMGLVTLYKMMCATGPSKRSHETFRGGRLNFPHDK
ncbi:MAG: hypothetical protein M0Z61_12420 [Nitrospiraceae bacterium]|nr:hypothetical protein [Nitrospiraceae bacterium]